jgi:predicted nucleic acid-binding protein
MRDVEAFFLDTNVWLYWIDSTQGGKYESSRQWVDMVWQHGVGRVSWQVLNEFYVNAERKAGASRESARALVESLIQWKPVGFDRNIFRRAWYWMDKADVHYWDSLILASAESAGCTYLLTEDFQTGQQFGDITVVNPLRRRPEEFGLS